MRIFLILILIYSSCFCQIKDIYEYGSKINDYIAHSISNSDQKEINLSQIDSIFSYALSIADSNIGEALLFCSIGTMTYPVFKVKIPIINVLVPFKIFTDYDKNLLQKKIDNLPSILFVDSPPSSFGDKDKIVHFFSTAYLSYLFGKKLSEFLGIFVEVFEENFKIDGKVDQRDLKINQLGSEFGQMLRYKIIFPSIILAKEKSLSYGKNINN